MKKLIVTLTLLACVIACTKPTYRYEYRSFDKKEDSRLETTEGRNKVLEEMQAQGWELVDPKEVRPGFTHMTFRRKVRD